MHNGRCRYHGGLAIPAGPHHPTYKHGRLSKYIPPKLSEAYAEAYADKQLLEIRSDVALLDTRRNELVQRIDTGESGSLWRKLREAWEELQSAQTDAKTAASEDNHEALARARERSASALTAIGRAIVAGSSNEFTWDEVTTYTERLVSMKEAELTRLRQLNQVITIEQMVGLVGLMHQAILQVVSDRHQQIEIGRIINVWLNTGRVDAPKNGDSLRTMAMLDPTLPTISTTGPDGMNFFDPNDGLTHPGEVVPRPPSFDPHAAPAIPPTNEILQVPPHETAKPQEYEDLI